VINADNKHIRSIQSGIWQKFKFGNKMKKTINNILLILIVISGFAQVPEWQWATKAGGIEWDSGMSIVSDTLGNSYLTGFFGETATFGSYYLTGSEEYNFFTAKISSDGNWLWANSIGGNDEAWGFSIAIDTDSNLYLTGGFKGTANFGSTTLTSNGSSDIFAAKLSSDGDWLWANNAGGNGWDQGRSISVDNFGDLYITGGFSNTVYFDEIVLTSNGGYNDIFIAKMNSDGDWLWANNAGGNDWDLSESITIDSSGNSYITGFFYGNANFGDITLTTNAGRDIFIAKVTSNGNWVWAKKAGGNGWDGGLSIAIDNSGNLYVTGFFASTASFGAISLTSVGGDDIFVAKLDLRGNWLWAKNAGGSSVWDWGRCITVDNLGNLYITGDFEGTAFFGETILTSFGSGDGFVAKLNSDGDWCWAQNVGGNISDQGSGLTVDSSENLYVTGYFSGVAILGSTMLTGNGSGDIFVAKLNVEVSTENDVIPREINLSNYPNPFNPTTTIEFSIQNDSVVELTIYNIKGQKIKTLAQNKYTIGSHSVTWNGDDDNNETVSSGIYYCELNVNGKTEAMKKCLLLK